MATNWPIAQIEEALGAVFKETKPGVRSLLITNRELGVRLRLEIAPQHDAARIYLDRDRQTRPTFIGRIDIFRIASIEADTDKGQVRFVSNHDCPHELLVTHHGTVRVVNGIDTTKVSDIPAEEAETPDEVTIIGKVGRPRYLEPKNIPLWTAGIGELRDGRLEPVWWNVEGWRGIATHAKHIERGQMVKATGRIREETYESKGETKTKQVLVLSAIEPV